MNFSIMLSWNFLIDFIIVSYLVYLVIRFSIKTRVFNILKGVVAIIAISILSDLWQLKALNFITSQIIVWGVIAVIIIFQSEIRQSLEKLGNSRLRIKNKEDVTEDVQTIEEITKATEYLAKRHIGALIILENHNQLKGVINGGIKIDSVVSQELLLNIFTPNTPLHDGAVLISHNKIRLANSYLPLTQREDLPQEFGTRHRAAIGLSEVSDAYIIVVSEETGHINLINQSEIYRDLSVNRLQKMLVEQFAIENKIQKSWFNNVCQAIKNRFNKKEN